MHSQKSKPSRGLSSRQNTSRAHKKQPHRQHRAKMHHTSTQQTHNNMISQQKQKIKRSFSTETETSKVDLEALDKNLEQVGDIFESLIQNANDNTSFAQISESQNFQRVRELSLFIEDRAIRQRFSQLIVTNEQVIDYCQNLLNDNPDHDYARAILKQIPQPDNLPENQKLVFRPSFWRHQQLNTTDFTPIEYIKFLSAVNDNVPIEDVTIWENVGMLQYYCGFPLDLVDITQGEIQTRYNNNRINETITDIVQSSITKSQSLMERMFIDSNIEEQYSYISAPWFQGLMQSSHYLLNYQASINAYTQRYSKHNAIPFVEALTNKSHFEIKTFIDDDGDEITVSKLDTPVRTLEAIAPHITFDEVYYLTLASLALTKLVAGYGLSNDPETPSIARAIIDNPDVSIAPSIDLDNISQFLLEPRNVTLLEESNKTLNNVLDKNVLGSRYWFDLAPGDFKHEQLIKFQFDRLNDFHLPPESSANKDAATIVESAFAQTSYRP